MNLINLQRPKVKRKKKQILRDTSRVITRFYMPDNPRRTIKIIQRVLDLLDGEAETLLEQIFLDFSERHKDIKGVFKQHHDKVKEFISKDVKVSESKEALIGAYFTMEYSIESAALFNPSIVPHPDQTSLPEGSLRYIMSLRAVGEGHISSIVFRSGVLDKNNTFIFDPVSHYVETPKLSLDFKYSRFLFTMKLHEIGTHNKIADHILNQLPENFTYRELTQKIDKLWAKPLFSKKGQKEVCDIMHWLANSNYQMNFSADHNVSERVLFPVSESERSGIEDARFVQFIDDNGEVTYYATYTAYSGFKILPQLIETKNFTHFNVTTLNGHAVKNKGLALFPRKIKGKYVMLSRQDGENNHIMYSDNIHFWQESKIIQEPHFPWEFMQIGNCGSPLETTEGWIVVTHGVGPMRKYSISAMLLDLNDPSKIIARLEEPLLVPQEGEREGYVPNVVYSCGALIHQNELIIPYAMSDITSSIATVGVLDLISSMKKC